MSAPEMAAGAAPETAPGTAPAAASGAAPEVAFDAAPETVSSAALETVSGAVPEMPFGAAPEVAFGAAPACAPRSVPVSVLIPTLDEELNLPECLASVSWADQVFVLDSYSHDRTVDIARAAGAIVVQHTFETYSRQKNWALDNLPWRNQWVLIVDADEHVTPELRDEIIDILTPESHDRSCITSDRANAGYLTSNRAHSGDDLTGNRSHTGSDLTSQRTNTGYLTSKELYTGYYINRRFMFLGTWIRHAGWYPSWNLRLFRRDCGRYDDRDVHEHVVLNGRAGYLRHDLVHADRRGLDAFVARHNRYSTLEAAARLKAERGAADRARLVGSLRGSPVERKRWLRERVWPRVPAQPLVLFVYMYVLRRGFLDGRAGLALCLFHAYQEFMVGLKLAELRTLSARR